jgi:hypothetical protein
MEDRYGSLSDLILFRLVTPPLQPGEVVPYLVWGVWFSSCVLLEEIGRTKIFGL